MFDRTFNSIGIKNSACGCLVFMPIEQNVDWTILKPLKL